MEHGFFICDYLVLFIWRPNALKYVQVSLTPKKHAASKAVLALATWEQATSGGTCGVLFEFGPINQNKPIPPLK